MEHNVFGGAKGGVTILHANFVGDRSVPDFNEVHPIGSPECTMDSLNDVVSSILAKFQGASVIGPISVRKSSLSTNAFHNPMRHNIQLYTYMVTREWDRYGCPQIIPPAKPASATAATAPTPPGAVVYDSLLPEEDSARVKRKRDMKEVEGRGVSMPVDDDEDPDAIVEIFN